MEGTGIFQDGFSARQVGCRVLFNGDELQLFFNAAENIFEIWKLQSFQSCHLNGTSLIIKYGVYPHKTLECHGGLAKEIYESWSQKRYVRKAEGLTFHRNHFAAIFFTLLFIGLGLFTWLIFLPWIGEKAAVMVPVEAEIGLGDRISSIYADENEVIDSAGYYLQEFVSHLELEDTYPLKANVIRSKEINAFALPGGRIFVYSGILDNMHSYEELVALLGHEVTHVTHRHSLKSICRSAATSIVIASLFGDITGISSGVMMQADKFKELDYSRDLETEADENGLRIMIDNKVSGKGMLALLELLEKESSKAPYLMKYLSTHPETRQRIRNIESNALLKNRFPIREDLQGIFTRLQNSILKDK